MASSLTFQTTIEVRDTCLCLHAQRAARALARRFDAALGPFGLSNKQFSLLMSLNRPEPPAIGPVARLLGMDRTTLTAALKPLERDGLVLVEPDERDARSRLLRLTPEGAARLAEAVPIWRALHREIEQALGEGEGDRLRAGLLAVSRQGEEAGAGGRARTDTPCGTGF